MTAREKILDAAFTVMHEKGLAAATTKEIAKAAGYSEATLYKYFDDKQDIFIRVLSEKMPLFSEPESLVGTGTVRGNLEDITETLLRFYVRSFPIAASIFSAPPLLLAIREGTRARNAGPRTPIDSLARYLEGERAAGRLPAEFDSASCAQLLAGAAMQQAFLATFDGLDEVPRVKKLAQALVAAALPTGS
ncbi:TetR/AcrR family transcriptional regulator [Leifsonia poae]|uniref:TetR/AcrR family transcriptional regulator n=1 Tax=Leifsonia poae TaxID=110933 RepID=UPI003D66865A